MVQAQQENPIEWPRVWTFDNVSVIANSAEQAAKRAERFLGPKERKMELDSAAEHIVGLISAMPTADKISALNKIRLMLHEISPFKGEPVDCVQWVQTGDVTANDYNPNSVAPPEMKLLEVSIAEDGYTQPIVTWVEDTKREVIDGFHRNRVGRESAVVRQRTLGYLPVVTVNDSRTDRSDRIAATIRHNRARGKHRVDAMSDIVVELKRRNWSDERVARELGMDQDEILRLCQITGLTELFGDQEFSKSWDVEGHIEESDFNGLTDDISTYGEDIENFRTVNTSDENRVFHTFDKWECYKAGFYATTKDGMSEDECEQAYKTVLTSKRQFKKALEGVTTEWGYSCEHYLTNAAMNRIAWLGQAAVCYATGVPSVYRSGFRLLTKQEQADADKLALVYLNRWLKKKKLPAVSMEEACSNDRQSNIY
jgi:ParB-like chromosome segregation protein Spo0J